MTQREYLLLTTLALSASSAAFAQGLDVAIVAAASTDPMNCRFTDTQAKLMATGQFSSVDIFNAATSAPTLMDLAPYDAVITWANSTYSDPVATGDAFADYVDTGGGVVVCMFALGAGTGGITPLQLQGRWASGYEIIDPYSGQTSGTATLGTVHVPSHPIMAGVNTFDGGSQSYRPRMSSLFPGGQAIAEWSDGTILLAVGLLPNRVDLAMYPPSSSCRSDFWDETTDGATLMANALVFAGTASLGTNYCSPAVANSTGASGAMSAIGSTAVASNDLTLVASDIPANSFGFFVTSQMQGFVMNAGGSQGNLCLGGAIGRYVGPGQIQNSGPGGEIELLINLSMHPTPTGLVQVQPGETWNFQAWFRDSVGGTATSNFTDGLEVLFN